ncbi:MAG: hypothetical protein R2838_20405 [Caldilineaceae bacterium]
MAQHLDVLNRIGFEVEPFGGDTFIVRAVPAVLAATILGAASTRSCRRWATGATWWAKSWRHGWSRWSARGHQGGAAVERHRDARIGAPVGGMPGPRTCPHGRPTMIQLSAGELEKAFGRI